MSRTVDLVVAGNPERIFDAVVGAVRKEQRVLVVLSTDTQTAQRFRRHVRRAANPKHPQLTVLANAEMVCVEALDCVEAVLIRHARTERLLAVNASGFVSDEGRDGLSREHGRCSSGIRALRAFRGSR